MPQKRHMSSCWRSALKSSPNRGLQSLDCLIIYLLVFLFNFEFPHGLHQNFSLLDLLVIQPAKVSLKYPFKGFNLVKTDDLLEDMSSYDNPRMRKSKFQSVLQVVGIAGPSNSERSQALVNTRHSKTGQCLACHC